MLTASFTGWTGATLPLSYEVRSGTTVLFPAGSNATPSFVLAQGTYVLKGRVYDGAGNFTDRLTTITGVEITRDLRHATVFVSVMGDEAERKLTLEGLTSAGHMMRGEVTRALRLRVAPELVFKYDDSLQRGARIEMLLAEIREQGGLGPVDPEPTTPPGAPGAAPADEDADGDERA